MTDRAKLEEGLEKLRRLEADNDPKTTIGAALIMAGGKGGALASALDAILLGGIKEGVPVSSALIIAMSNIGFRHGTLLDPAMPLAGQAVDSFSETLIKVFRYSVDEGFANAMKARENRNADRDD